MWSNWSDLSWLKRTKENRKLEELILAFVSAANKMTEKSPDVELHFKHEILDQQLDVFLLLLESVAKALGPIGRDVILRLESMHNSASHINVDERDDSISKWNILEETVEGLLGPRPGELTDDIVLEVSS